MSGMDWREEAKKIVALKASEHVKHGFVLGLGSGTTVEYVFEELGKRIRTEGLDILGVPSSHQAALSALKCKIPLTTLDEYPELDLTIDGTDQVDKSLNLIKGMGGALTREKIISSVSKFNIRIADETKLTEKLGRNHFVPIEIIPFAYTVIKQKLMKIGGKPKLREGNGKIGPAITDNGNFILDVDFGPIEDPESLDQKIKIIPGIIETGLFIGMADLVYVGTRQGKLLTFRKETTHMHESMIREVVASR
jgi:ribose 5-phosphate isomerase A